MSKGESYKFTHLTTREYNGEMSLSTTKETIIEKVPLLFGLGSIVALDKDQLEEPFSITAVKFVSYSNSQNLTVNVQN